MTKAFGPRRADWLTVDEADAEVDATTVQHLERFDLIYRSVCSVMFNFTQSGHPGGSVSSGPRLVRESHPDLETSADHWVAWCFRPETPTATQPSRPIYDGALHRIDCGTSKSHDPAALRT